MILAASILFFALFSPVELFKFHKAPEDQSGELLAQRQYGSGLYLGAPRYYPLPADFFQAPPQQAPQQQLFQQPQFEQQQQLPLNEPQLNQATKGGELKATKGLEQRPQLSQESYLQQVPYVQPQPASIAYLVVRPIQSFLPASIPQPQLPLAQVLRPPFKQEEPAGIKGGRQTDLQGEQAIQQIEQQHEIAEQQQPLQPALVVPVPPGKEGKFKALLDRLMSKLTLGSSYQVTHEEIVQSPAQRQPLAPQQIIQQQPIEQQQQQKIEQLEEQRLEQQLEQQRDNFFDEGLKQTKGHQEQQFQQQQQIRDEQLQQQQQNLADLELQKQRDQQAYKGQQQPLQQEPIRQEIEPARQEPIKGKRLLPDRLAGQQQIQQQQLQQEPLRQEAKGNAGF